MELLDSRSGEQPRLLLSEDGIAGFSDDRHLLARARVFRTTTLLERMLDPEEFLLPHGVRALSRSYRDHPFAFEYGGLVYRMARSDSGLFGGNLNWRAGLDAGQFLADRPRAGSTAITGRDASCSTSPDRAI